VGVNVSYIELKNLHKRYNINTAAEVHALRGVDLKIEKGELLSIIGPSGSGKSTLLHILGCIDIANEGSFKMNEVEVNELKNDQLADIRNKKMGFVLQEFGLLLNQTAFDNVSVPLMFDKISLKEIKGKVLNALKDVGVEELAFKKVSQLSGGQKQRVAIARALVNNPEIILADEPTGALDNKTSGEIVYTLLELNRSGRTIIIVTHNIEVAKKCSRIITIEDGVIVKGSK